MKKFLLIPALLVIVISVFILFDSCKMINSSYSIQKWEDGVTYYLLGPSDHLGWGALEGTIGKIGWNEEFILVWQNDDGQCSGWRVINVNTDKLSSLIKSNELNNIPQVGSIKTYEAKAAWDKLKF